MSAVVSASVLRAIREAAAEVPNAKVPAVELHAIVTDSLQEAVDLALVSGYRARTAKMLDGLLGDLERWQPLGFPGAPDVEAVESAGGPLNPAWVGTDGAEGLALPRRGIRRA